MKWLETLPSTNLRILVGIVLSVIYVIGNMVAGWNAKLPPIEYVWALGVFIATQMGLDVAQFVFKRKTSNPEMFAAGLSRESVDPRPSAPGVGTAPATSVTMAPLATTGTPAKAPPVLTDDLETDGDERGES